MVRNTDEVEVKDATEKTEGVKEKKAESPEAESITDLGDVMIEEALKDALAVNEEVAGVPAASQELKELIAFKEECEALFRILDVPRETLESMLTGESIDLKTAMKIAAKMVGIVPEEELLDGEPSPYVQELFKKIRQKYTDCKWFFAVLKGKKAITPGELKYVQMPEELKAARGERV
jgi:hypothetical protein